MDAASYLKGLRDAAEAAKTAETGYRREAARRIAALEQERAFAFRRLNLMHAIAASAESADSEEIAVASVLATLRARLGWTSDSEARAELLEHFNPVAIAVARTALAEEDAPDIGGALSAFERWHAESRGASFWGLFEQTMPDTPRTDF
ncbi:MAG TPA: hypothetical protein VNS34_14685 [Rhizobiaceae bacterium]|nr:hypothetical protein [Rhizobiaceae bacterium]